MKSFRTYISEKIDDKELDPYQIEIQNDVEKTTGWSFTFPSSIQDRGEEYAVVFTSSAYAAIQGKSPQKSAKKYAKHVNGKVEKISRQKTWVVKWPK